MANQGREAPGEDGAEDRLEDCLIVEAQSEAALTLEGVAQVVRESRRALVVFIAEALSVELCSHIGSDRVMVLPTPHDPSVMLQLSRQIAALCARRRGAKPAAPASPNTVLVLSPRIRLDVERRLLLWQDKECSLSRGEAGVLQYLTQREGSWCSSEAIAIDVFARKDDAALNLVWKYVSRVRKRLEDSSDLIECARTFGYRLRRTAA